MKYTFAGTLGAAAALSLSMAAFAQTTGQSPTPQSPRTPPSTTTAAPQQPTSAAGQAVTVVGCIQREADYRKANNLGSGTLGTGVGVGNEFVVTNASMASATGGASPSAGAATGTAGAAASAYELTGPNESKASQFVGKRVEIMGTLKPAETAGAAPTGGPTAGAPPRGVDVASQDLKLRELEVTSVRESTGTCSSQ